MPKYDQRIRQQTNGSYAFVVDLPADPITGKRNQKRSRGYRTKGEAQDALDAILVAVKRDGWRNAQATVSSVAADWLATVKVSKAQATYEHYEQAMRLYVAPLIGGKRIEDVTPTHLLAVYNQPALEGKSVRTREKVHQTCSALYSFAEDTLQLTRNPARVAGKHIDRPQISHKADESWTAGELSEFLTAAAGRRDYPLWYVLAMTGMRRGELMALTWRDIELDADPPGIRVTKALKKEGVGPTKNRQSRIVDIGPGTVAVLRGWRQTLLADSMANQWRQTPASPVWVHESGAPFHPQWVSRTFDKLIPDHLPRITLHQLRHCHATMGFEEGVHLAAMQQRLGHSTSNITANIYTAARRSVTSGVASLIEAALVTNWSHSHPETGSHGVT